MKTLLRLFLALQFLVGGLVPSAIMPRAYSAEHWNGAAATLETPSGPSRTGSTINFSNNWTKGAKLVDPTVHDGDVLNYTLTIANYSGTGSVEVYASNADQTACTGTWENNTAGTDGQTPIPDNFDTNAALQSLSGSFPGGIDYREGDTNGSFRFTINTAKAKYARDDPMVCPGKPGRSHLHQFFCNTGINAYTTYRSLRTTGGTSCGDPRYPVNRSAYWTPVMVDGAGHIVPWFVLLTYYKTIPTNHVECNPPIVGDVPQLGVSHLYVGKCIAIPHGLKYIAGFNMTTMTGGPAADSGMRFACTTPSGWNTEKAGTGSYYTIEAVRAAGCGLGDYLYIAIDGPQCWDGLHTDSPNHMDHVSRPTGGGVTLTVRHDHLEWPGDSDDLLGGWPGCPQTHPYLIPGFSIQGAMKIDQNFVDGHWHLSSDEQMPSAMAPGTTLHMDYWMGWSPPIRDRWQGSPTTPGPHSGIGTGCINGRNNGNGGSLCDGYGIRMMGGVGTSAPTANAKLIPTAGEGWSRPLKGNGTYRGQLRVAAGGLIGLYPIGGFTGDVTLSITDVAKVGKDTGPVVSQ